MELLKPGEMYRIHKGDCIQHMADMPAASVDACFYSPPFPSVFSYSNSESDIGNSEDVSGEAALHFGFFFRALRRVMKPGRVMVCHCTQIHKSKRDGERGVFDFRGMLIRLASRAGFTFEYDWLIRQDPQAQAIRTKKWEIKFQGLETDRSQSRGAMGDYLLKFITPGKNQVPVTDKCNPSGDFKISTQVSRNDWIKWAECCWDDIIGTDTLNVAEGRGEDDTRHICPLQLEIVRRLTLLYTNPGEIVFSPFAGIGSEGFMPLGGVSPKTKKRVFDQRRFYGCELKGEYHAAAIKNCERALRDHALQQRDLFSDVEQPELAESDA